MLELLLLRHAKSTPATPGQDDHERGLEPRGEKAAQRVGHLMAEHGLVPDLALCSTAVRTRATWEIVSGRLRRPVPVKELRTLYLAPPGRLLEIVQRQPEAVRRLLLIGHNPGLHALAVRLAGTGDAAALQALREKLPTAALVHLGFEGIDGWGAVAVGTGRLLGSWRPRELA